MLMRRDKRFIVGETEAQKKASKLDSWLQNPSSSAPHIAARCRNRQARVKQKLQEEISFLTEGCWQTMASI